MATCRECLHYEACLDYCTEKVLSNRGVCEHYTPKSEYVKRERGEWVKQQFVQSLFDFNGVEYAQVSARCTNCGRDIYDVVDSEGKEKFDYINYKICPHCSADMRKEDNNEDNLR